MAVVPGLGFAFDHQILLWRSKIAEGNIQREYF